MSNGFFFFFTELQLLWRQFLRFKEAELPAKEADKDRSKLIYHSFEVCFTLINVEHSEHFAQLFKWKLFVISNLIFSLMPEQSAVQAGQIKVPPGYHLIDVEKEWGRLHVAILERERLLRTEFER